MVPMPSEFLIKPDPNNDEFPFVILQRAIGSQRVTNVYQVTLTELARFGRHARELVEAHIGAEFIKLNIPEKSYHPYQEGDGVKAEQQRQRQRAKDNKAIKTQG